MTRERRARHERPALSGRDPEGVTQQVRVRPRCRSDQLDRLLSSSVVYPTYYGYVPETRAADGNPLDALICVTEPAFPACLIERRPVALFRMRDEKGPDDKVVCVPLRDPNRSSIERLEDVPKQLRDEIAHFLSGYKDLETEKEVAVEGWRPRDDPVEVLDESRAVFAGGPARTMNFLRSLIGAAMAIVRVVLGFVAIAAAEILGLALTGRLAPGVGRFPDEPPPPRKRG